MPPKPPVAFTPSVERLRPDEDDIVRQLEASFEQILDTTTRDYGRGVRAVHAKAHGIARGTFTVVDDLPPDLAQGLFAHPGRYEAVIRLSTNPGDILDDAIGLPRGLALKVVGVPGDRLTGSEGDKTQDFITVNAPTFSAPDAAAFAKNLKLLAKTTDKAEGAKKILSTVLRGAEAALETVGLESATLQQMGGAKQVHPLGETYWSQTPFRYGDYMAKFQIAPVSPALIELAGTVIAIDGRRDALREEVRAVLAAEGGRWAFRVQLARDPDAMPIEDPTQAWDEEASPFGTVAMLDIPPQDSWDEAAQQLDEALSYNIWHALAAHRPLGNINRARRDPYRFSAAWRGRVNGCPMHEPTTLADLPGGTRAA